MALNNLFDYLGSSKGTKEHPEKPLLKLIAFLVSPKKSRDQWPAYLRQQMAKRDRNL
jgi:hypothetical protein